MGFYADPRNDLPADWKPKRAIFYAQGLKVYGQIPYVLQRRLQAQFISNEFRFLGGRVRVPTAERNYTIIPFHRDDGERHSAEALDALLAWLEAGAGYEWAIAAGREFGRSDLYAANALNEPPKTWTPDPAQGAATLLRLALKEGERE